jgi:hypothetical protein
MEAKYFSETSGSLKYTGRYNPEDRNFNESVVSESVKMATHHLMPSSRMVELYLHSPMYLRDRVPNYIIKHKDNLKVAPLKLLRNL